jgi:hypothetical protein
MIGIDYIAKKQQISLISSFLHVTNAGITEVVRFPTPNRTFFLFFSFQSFLFCPAECLGCYHPAELKRISFGSFSPSDRTEDEVLTQLQCGAQDREEEFVHGQEVQVLARP